jgi:beta-mannosidase
VKLKVSGKTSSGTQAKVEVQDAAGKIVASKDSRFDGDELDVKLNIESPKLWWPNGHGEQPLYTVAATLSGEKEAFDSTSKRIGIRTITLIQRPLDNEPGTTFMFNVNGIDIFVQGGDWIPADNLLPRITKDIYFNWIKMAKRGNLNMIRVWGGGIYETEDFFDACDELGLLVWHDYAFACGDFPIHDEFLESVNKEVKAQTLRLRGRTSLALLCGGNEDFMLADYEGEPLPGTIMKK